MHPIRSHLLEHQRSALRLLISTTDHELAYCTLVEWKGTTYPSSKCLQRLSANCALVLQTVHSSLKTTFFVVLAFLWKTGFVWPPYPDCLRSYRRFPCATEEAWKKEEDTINWRSESFKVSPCEPFQLCIGLLYAGYASCNPCLCSRCGGFWERWPGEQGSQQRRFEETALIKQRYIAGHSMKEALPRNWGGLQRR